PIAHRPSLRSSSRTAAGVAAPGSRSSLSRKSPKLPNPHFASRKLRVNLQLAAHRLDGFAQRAQENVGAALDLRHSRLIDAQGLGEPFLRDSYCPTEFVESHFLDPLLRFGI